jgi:hypothetical protein
MVPQTQRHVKRTSNCRRLIAHRGHHAYGVPRAGSDAWMGWPAGWWARAWRVEQSMLIVIESHIAVVT